MAAWRPGIEIKTMPTAKAAIPAMGLMKIVCGRDTSQAKKPKGPATWSVEK